MSGKGIVTGNTLLWVPGGLLVAFLAAPLVALFALTTLADVAHGVSHPLMATALGLSLLTTTSSLGLVVLLGSPLAWLLANSRSRWSRLLETLLQVPIVIPPAVAGVALLLAFGRRGLFGSWLYPEGWAITFTTGAVVVAQVFVSAPLFLQAAVNAFRRLDPEMMVVARTLGASRARVFLSIAVPVAAPGLVAGAAMSWARSLGEFGATLMFAGNLEGRTQTLPLAIYTALESDPRAAQALSVVLVCVAFSLLLFVHVAMRSRSGLER